MKATFEVDGVDEDHLDLGAEHVLLDQILDLLPARGEAQNSSRLRDYLAFES